MRNININYWRSALTAIFLVIIFLSSCKKPESDIGLGLQDGLLQTASDTTVSINSQFLRVDSIKTDSLSYNLCGNYIDPIFGRTQTAMSFNLNLSSTDVDFGNTADLEVDSMVLSMKYSGYAYGKFVSQEFSVKEILSEFNKDSTYYSDDYFELGNELIDPNNTTYQIDLNSDVVVGTQTWDPQLRLFLDNSFGEYLLSNSGDEMDQWNNEETFKEFFSGLHVQSYTYNGAVIGYDVKDFDTRLTMYYRNTVEEDTLEYVFFVEQESATLTNFRHQYTDGLSGLNSMDSIVATDLVYVQAGSSVETKISIPDLDSAWMNGESINKAEIVVPVNSSDHMRFARPVSLVVTNRDDEGVVDFLPDEAAFSNYNAANNEYRFNISLYLQKVLTGELENRDLYIIPLSGGISVNRVVLQGPEFDPAILTNNMRLEITYTK